MRLTSQIIRLSGGREIDVIPLMKKKVFFRAIIAEDGQMIFMQAKAVLATIDGTGSVFFNQMTEIKVENNNQRLIDYMRQSGYWFAIENILTIELESK